MSSAPKNRPLNPRRIGVIMMHTFTQLVRMKVFYFLGIFSVILLASNLFDIQNIDQRPDLDGTDVLRSIRSWSLGTMTLFSVVLGVVATALLLPKDIEDRTLYTVLAKPVPRLDYLIGKLFGVLMLLFVSLALMDVLMSAVLAIRTHYVVAEQVAGMKAAGWSEDQMEVVRQQTMNQGVTWSLHGGVLIVFLRATVVASLSLLLSTFTTSTLFTTITGLMMYFIGNFEQEALSMYLGPQGGMGPLERLVSMIVMSIFPNFSIYNLVDSVIEGTPLLLGDLGGMIGITAYYLVLHLFVSWIVFAKKEF